MNEGFLGARGNRPENGNGPTFPRQVGALGTAANGVYAERAREEGNFGFEPFSSHKQTYS